MTTIDLTTSWEVDLCNKCGVQYALPKAYMDERRKDRKSWACPNCRTEWSFKGESNEERYKRLYEKKQACCIRAEERAAKTERRFNGMKGYVGRLKKLGR